MNSREIADNLAIWIEKGPRTREEMTDRFEHVLEIAFAKGQVEGVSVAKEAVDRALAI